MPKNRPGDPSRFDSARTRWFDDYLARCLERDLVEEGRVRQPAALAPVLTRLASQTAKVLNISSAGRAVGLAASTASDYMKLFEAAFLVRLLPAWGRTLRSATGSRPNSTWSTRALRLSSPK